MAHKTYMREIEGSEKALFFVHGFLSSTEHFDRFIEVLPENVSIFNILLPGHGGKVRDFAKTSMTEWKSAVREMAEHICKQYKDVYIIAHSMGSFFAMEAAIKHCDRVRGILLLQPALKIWVKPEATLNTVKAFFNFFGNEEVSKAYRASHSISLSLRFWEYIGWLPRYFELLKESHIARESIKQVSVPCTVCQSKKDELVSIKTLKYIPHKENMTVHILEKSAHFFYNKQDEKFMKDILLEMIK